MALLSKQTIRTVISQNEERKGSFTDNKPLIEAGERILYLSHIEIKESKNKVKMLALQISENKDKRYITDNYMLSGNGADLGLNRAVSFLANAFGYEIAECETEKELLIEFLKFKDKTFKAAVKIKEQLYEFTDKDGKKELKVTKQPKVWYVGKIDDVKFFVGTDPNKLKEDLSTEDKKRFMDFHNGQPVNAKKETTAETENDGLPF